MQCRLHLGRSRLEQVSGREIVRKDSNSVTDSDTDWMSAKTRPEKSARSVGQPSTAAPGQNPTTDPDRPTTGSPPGVDPVESSLNQPAAHRRHPTPHREDRDQKAESQHRTYVRDYNLPQTDSRPSSPDSEVFQGPLYSFATSPSSSILIRFPQAERLSIPDAGHLMLVQNPQSCCAGSGCLLLPPPNRSNGPRPLGLAATPVHLTETRRSPKVQQHREIPRRRIRLLPIVLEQSFSLRTDPVRITA